MKPLGHLTLLSITESYLSLPHWSTLHIFKFSFCMKCRAKTIHANWYKIHVLYFCFSKWNLNLAAVCGRSFTDRQKLVDLVNRNATACCHPEYDDVCSVLLKSKLWPKYDEWLLLKFNSSLNSFVSVYQLGSNFTSAHLVCILSSFAKFNPSLLKV